MPIGFEHFQIVLAVVMICGLLAIVGPLAHLAGYARAPRLSAILILVPLVGIVWWCLIASAMRPNRPAREKT
jgi:hypothetical protein